MATADTVVIDITTEYKDSTDSGLNKAQKSADKFVQSIEKAKKQAEVLKRSTAAVDLKANDKATSVIEKTKAQVKSFAGSAATVSLNAIDKTVSTFKTVKSGISSIAGKTFSFTATMVDKATAPLRALFNYATSIKGVITGLLAGMAANTMISEPTSMADTMTTALIGFETKFKDAEKAASFMKEVEQFAIDTPFETEDLIGISQRMLAFNWDSETLISDLNSIGNAAAATGKGSEGIDRVTLALSQMKSKGKVSAEEMLQLTEAGINGWDYLAQSMGVSVAQVQEMTQDGLVPVDDAIRAIISGMDEFDGMMEKTANKTVSGLKSQIMDTFNTKIVLKWGQGLQEGGIAALTKINSWLSDNADKVQNWGEKFKAVATDVSTWIGDKVQGSLENLDKALSRSDFDSAGLMGKIGIIGEEVILKPLKDWWSGGGKEDVKDLFKDVASTAGEVIIEGIPMAMEAIFSNGVTGTLAIAYGVKTGANIISGINNGLGNFNLAKTALTHFNEAMALSSAGLTAFAGETSLLYSALSVLSGPVGIVIAAVGLLGGALAGLYFQEKEQRENLYKLGDAYEDSVKNLEDVNKAYDESTKKLTDNSELVKEYRDITNDINSGAYTGDELNSKLDEQATKLEELKNLYPEAFGENMSVGDSLVQIDNLIAKEQAYQDLLKERADIEMKTAQYELVAQLPDLEKQKTDLEEQMADQEIEVAATLKFKNDSSNFFQELGNYNLAVEAGVEFDTSNIDTQITGLSAYIAKNLSGDERTNGMALVSEINTAIDKGVQINPTKMAELGELASGAFDKWDEEQSKLDGLKSSYETIIGNIDLANGITGDISDSTSDLSNSTSDLTSSMESNQATAETTNSTVSDTNQIAQETDASMSSAADSATDVVSNSQSSLENATAIKTMIDEANTALAGLSSSMGELDTSGYTEKVTGMTTITQTAMDTIKQIITDKSTEAIESGKAQFDAFCQHVNGLSPQFYTYGQDMMHEFIAGIDSLKANAGSEIDAVVAIMLEKFRTGLGIHSPSTVLRTIGRYAIQGLMQGLNGDDLMAFCDRIVEDIKTAFQNGDFNLKVGTEFIGDGAAEFFKSIGVGGATVEGLIKPVDGTVTSGFGWREPEMTASGEYSSNYHGGIDIGAATGTPVYAAGAGTVEVAGWYGGYGNAVKIDHGNGLETLYGHLSQVLVSVGQLVNQMDKIGLVGSTGNSTGSHLHFSIFQDGQAIDPGALWGYARGTRSASPGIHWVGENGPELVGFNGGEAVLNSFQSGKLSDVSSNVYDFQTEKAKRRRYSTGFNSNDDGDSSSSTVGIVTSDGTPVVVNIGSMGGIHISLDSNGASDPEEIAKAVKEQMPDLTNQMCLEIARQLGQIYSGMPTKFAQ